MSRVKRDALLEIIEWEKLMTLKDKKKMDIISHGKVRL